MWSERPFFPCSCARLLITSQWQQCQYYWRPRDPPTNASQETPAWDWQPRIVFRGTSAQIKYQPLTNAYLIANKCKIFSFYIPSPDTNSLLSCSSHLLYQRKLRANLHRRLQRLESQCSPHRRALHSKVTPKPLKAYKNFSSALIWLFHIFSALWKRHSRVLILGTWGGFNVFCCYNLMQVMSFLAVSSFSNFELLKKAKTFAWLLYCLGEIGVWFGAHFRYSLGCGACAF